jgi:hypothetical protein
VGSALLNHTYRIGFLQKQLSVACSMRQNVSKEMAVAKGLQNAYQFSGVLYPEKNNNMCFIFGYKDAIRMWLIQMLVNKS